MLFLLRAHYTFNSEDVSAMSYPRVSTGPSQKSQYHEGGKNNGISVIFVIHIVKNRRCFDFIDLKDMCISMVLFMYFGWLSLECF